MCTFMLDTFDLEHQQPTVELCATAIAFFLAFSWHAEPRIKGKGEVASEGYVRFQDNHLIIGMLPRVLNCECHTYRTCALPSLYSRTAPQHTSLAFRPIALVPQGCATPTSARQCEPRPTSRATLPNSPSPSLSTLPPRHPTHAYLPHTRTPVPARRPVAPRCPRSDRVLRNYQAAEMYVPEEPPKTTATNKKRKAPAGRMVTSSKGAKLPF